jgi:hypothetical protein
MMLPPLTPHGVLPPSPDGEPYAVYQSEFERMFVTDANRVQIWQRFCGLKELVDLVAGDAMSTPLTWWIWQRFITSATDVDQIDVVLFVPPMSTRAFQVLAGLLRSSAARDLLSCTIVVLNAVDLAERNLYRRRCSKNTPVDRGDGIHAGWVELL